MTITHHPDVSTLMSYSAGSLAEPLAAVVASHAAICPQCRTEIARMEAVGAALFAALGPSECVRPAPLNSLRRAECDVEPAPEKTVSGDVPSPLVKMIGPHLRDIAWKRLGFGIWHLPMPLSPGTKGDLRLIKVAPGLMMPEHGHGGTELTLLLQGSYKDEFGHFQTGDISDLDENAEHQPVSDPQEGCICLIASTERAKFKGLLARIVQPLTGM